MNTTYCEYCGFEFHPEERNMICHNCQKQEEEPEQEDMSDIKLIDIY